MLLKHGMAASVPAHRIDSRQASIRQNLVLPFAIDEVSLQPSMTVYWWHSVIAFGHTIVQTFYKIGPRLAISIFFRPNQQLV
jgi:hypothetical protein